MQLTIGKKLALGTGFLLCLFIISVVLTMLQTDGISREIADITNTQSQLDYNVAVELVTTQNSILDRITKLHLLAGILLVSALTFGLLSAFMIYRNISTPLNQLQNATRDLINWREYKPINIDTNDEFEELAGSFNDMAKELLRAKTELQQAHYELEMKVEERTEKLKESYQALAKLEKRFSELLNSSPAAIYAMSLDQPRRYRFVSHAFNTLTGFEPEDIIANPEFWQQHMHPDDRKQCTDAIEKAINTGGDIITYRIRHKNGDYRWIRDMFHVVKYTTHEPREIIGDWADITNEYQSSQALLASEERFRTASESSNDFIYELNITTGALQWFGNIEGALHYAPGEFRHTQKAWEESLHPEDRERVIESRNKHFSNPSEPFSQQYRMRTSDGQYRIWVDRGKLVLRDGKPTDRFIGSCTDITKAKRLEQQFLQSQKMETVGMLAGGVAHDFNNLLTAIIGFSDMVLQEDDLSPSTREYISEVKSAGERASDLTRQLLAFSRKQVIAPVILQLNDVVSRMDKMLRRLLGEHIQLVLKLEPTLQPINADPSQMEQIVMNLAVNARDAMPTGGRIIVGTRNVELDEYFIQAHPDMAPGKYVMLTVSDTGSGIKPEDQARIFEPFFTTKEKGKGTGLGLATVYGVVKQSSGGIFLQSEIGVGTTFSVYLPAIAHVEKTPEKTVDASLYKSRSNETILLVEDEASVLAITQAILKKYGYTVLAANSGDAALKLCDQHQGPIHLLLTDVLMPGMNGKELSSRITTRYPDTKVLFMSGYTDDHISRQGVLNEGTALLPKPFTGEALARRVMEMLHPQAL